MIGAMELYGTFGKALMDETEELRSYTRKPCCGRNLQWHRAVLPAIARLLIRLYHDHSRRWLVLILGFIHANDAAVRWHVVRKRLSQRMSIVQVGQYVSVNSMQMLSVDTGCPVL